MGQPVVVIERPAPRPDVAAFEINRSLTGMGHERYRSAPPPGADRPPDVLARRIFERGGVRAVHVYSNAVTVELTPGTGSDGLKELLEELFVHYREGVQPAIP
ncbi:MAG: hypothetical protein ACRD1K_09200 [Acidimicrobiales bacterium]